jgi:hypothetical protein
MVTAVAIFRILVFDQLVALPRLIGSATLGLVVYLGALLVLHRRRLMPLLLFVIQSRSISNKTKDAVA